MPKSLLSAPPRLFLFDFGVNKEGETEVSPIAQARDSNPANFSRKPVQQGNVNKHADTHRSNHSQQQPNQ